MAERGFGTVPAQCPHSARDSARLEFIAVPAVRRSSKDVEVSSFLLQEKRTAGTAMIPRRALSRALCGHCAGTARALCRTHARPRACSPRVLLRSCIRRTTGQSFSQPTSWHKEIKCSLFEMDVHVLSPCRSPPHPPCNDSEALEMLRLESSYRRWTMYPLPHHASLCKPVCV